MFEKVKKVNIDKISNDLKNKTEKLVDSISDAVDDLGDSTQVITEKLTKLVESEPSENKTNNGQIAIDVDIIGPQKEDDVFIDIEESEPEKAKNALDYLREEIRERSSEKQDLKEAIKKEELRLAAAREEARNKNVLRKIKVVDNAYSKKEIERDEQALIDYKNAEKKKIDEARVQRSREIASKNKKPIAVALASIVAACGIFGGVSTHSHNVALAEDYNYAVSCIVEEQYEEAVNTLSGLDYNDSGALWDYAYVQSELESYKGNPEDMLNSLTIIDNIDNEEVRVQYNDACKELELADEIQDDIDNIKITTVEDISEEKLSEIEMLTAKLDKRYQILLSTDSYDLAKRVLENVNNDTDAGILMAAINNLGDISLESKDVLDDLRNTYNNLSSADKETILNYKTLTTAESTYASLKKAEDERIAAEKKAEEERIAAEKKAEEEARIAAEAAVAKEKEDQEKASMTVYVTKTGKKYHHEWCSYLKSIGGTYTQGNALRCGYEPCSKCIHYDEVPSYYRDY